MSNETVIYILLANAAVAVLFLIFGLIFNKDKFKVFLYFIIFILCPVFSVIAFALSTIFYSLKHVKKLEISGVKYELEPLYYVKKDIFPDAADVVPIEDVLRVSATKDRRERLLDIIKKDYSSTISAYNLAVMDKDSEVAHYAAAILAKTRDTYDRIFSELSAGYDKDRTDATNNIDYLSALREYLNCGIKLFSAERTKYKYTYTHLVINLYNNHPELTTQEMFYDLIHYLVDLSENNMAREWLDVFEQRMPLSESMFISRLYYCYVNKYETEFFDMLNRLKSSGIAISARSLDLIRFFSARTATPVIQQQNI